MASRITPDHLRTRWERVWATLEEEGFTALIIAGRGVITQYGHLEYVIGYSPVIRHAYAIISSRSEPILIVPTRADAWFARKMNAVEDVRVAGEGNVIDGYGDFPPAVISALNDIGAVRGTVGIVGLDIVPVSEYKAIQQSLDNIELEDATSLLARVKAIKDEEDIRQLYATAEIADAGLNAFADNVRPEATGWELRAEMERAVYRLGARDALIFIGSGPYFLSYPDFKPLQRGDLVTVYSEISGPSGYWVERAGLFAIGALDNDRQRLAHGCLEAIRAAEAALHPGRTAGDVASAIERSAESLGAKFGLWHGHGVGVDHDVPVITASDDTLLAEGMVISVHPNFSDAEELIGASVADTYVLGDNGPRRLSKVPQELHHVNGGQP